MYELVYWLREKSTHLQLHIILMLDSDDMNVLNNIKVFLSVLCQRIFGTRKIKHHSGTHQNLTKSSNVFCGIYIISFGGRGVHMFTSMLVFFLLIYGSALDLKMYN